MDLHNTTLDLVMYLARARTYSKGFLADKESREAVKSIFRQAKLIAKCVRCSAVHSEHEGGSSPMGIEPLTLAVLMPSFTFYIYI